MLRTNQGWTNRDSLIFLSPSEINQADQLIERLVLVGADHVEFDPLDQ